MIPGIWIPGTSFTREGVCCTRSRSTSARWNRAGAPAAVVDSVGTSNPPVYQFAVSASGSLVYVLGAAIAGRTLAWVDRQGREQAIGAPARAYSYPRLSPDGTRLAVASRDQEQDLWSWEFSRGTLTRLTFGPGLELYPTWTADGRRIIFNSNLNQSFSSIYSMAADGTGVPERRSPLAPISS